MRDVLETEHPNPVDTLAVLDPPGLPAIARRIPGVGRVLVSL